jgi:hypothetical protein
VFWIWGRGSYCYLVLTFFSINLLRPRNGANVAAKMHFKGTSLLLSYLDCQKSKEIVTNSWIPIYCCIYESLVLHKRHMSTLLKLSMSTISRSDSFHKKALWTNRIMLLVDTFWKLKKNWLSLRKLSVSFLCLDKFISN